MANQEYGITFRACITHISPFFRTGIGLHRHFTPNGADMIPKTKKALTHSGEWFLFFLRVSENKKETVHKLVRWYISSCEADLPFLVFIVPQKLQMSICYYFRLRKQGIKNYIITAENDGRIIYKKEATHPFG